MKKTASKFVKKLLGDKLSQKLGKKIQSQKYAKEVSAIGADPLNPELHLALAKRHMADSGNQYVAFSEIKTAAFLGGDSYLQKCEALISRLKIPETDSLTHNKVFRYESIVNEIIKTAAGEKVSILDVGGGHGQLACFLPAEYQYCLAEPTTNGLRGEDLPFDDKSFDLVVSCHVLEHVPLAQRELFLDTLSSKARKAVILLNPFEIPGTEHEKRLELMYSITGAGWVKEHIDCVLPTREFINDYVVKRNYSVDIQNNGSSTTTLAMVYVSYFASLAGRDADCQRIQEFFNSLDHEVYNSGDYPNALMVTIRVDK